MSKKWIPMVFLFCLFCTTDVFSQSGVGINADDSAPNPNAMLDVVSPQSGNGKGVLIPRMSESQRTAPDGSREGGLLDNEGNLRGGAAQGLLVYQTDGVQGFYYNTSLTSTPSWAYLGNGTVTSVTAAAPLTGGEITTSGSIGIAKADAGTDGYLSSADWTTFNSKGSSDLALGETDTTAYRGDRGKSAYDATLAATEANEVLTIVKRSAAGNFSAGTITANLVGNVTGNASNVTGTVAVANGGTGAADAPNARTNLGIDAIASKKSNLSAGSAPTADDDITKGYGVGSVWMDTSSDTSYQCFDATQGVAVWKTSISSGGTVTSITASAPLTGGVITTSGSIGIAKANAGTDGYLSSADWTTFNSKGSSNLVLGETATTAYRGDRGKSAYDDTQAATEANTPSAIARRDASGNFSAGTITADLAGNADTATNADAVTNGVYTVGDQTIGGTKTFTSAIAGSVTGTSSNVTGTVAVANGGTGAADAPNARTNLGIDAIAAAKSNLSAVLAPTVNNDTTEGYAAGSQWIDVAADTTYICVDATDGAAVWRQTDSSSDATRALDNLDSVAINTSLLPGADNSVDLGSAPKSWKNIYVEGAISDGANSATVANIATLDGTQALTNKTINPASNSISLASGKFLIGNAGNLAEAQTITGDVSISNGGVSTIQPNSVSLGTQTTGNYVATVADSGGGTITVAGSGAEGAAVTLDLAGNAVTTGKIADNNVTLAKIADGGADQVLTTDGANNPQWENKGIFTSSSLAQNHIFVGDAANTAADSANLPAVALPTGGNWTIGSNLNIDSDTLVVDQANNRVGIGSNAPTAALQLKAGTAAASTAPLKLTTGVNLAAPEAGAIEYDGSNLYFTPSTSRKTVAFTDSSSFNPRNYSYFFDDFEANSTTGMVWAASNATGTQAVATVTPADNAIGVLTFSTGAVAAGRSCLLRSLTGLILGKGEFMCEARVNVAALSTVADEFAFAVGLHDNTAKAAVDGVYFIYDRLAYAGQADAGANWRCVTANNSVATATNSGVAVAAGSWVRLKCVVNAAGTQATFYINDALVATNNTNIPTAAGRVTGPRILLLKSAGLNARTANVDFWYHEATFTTAR